MARKQRIVSRRERQAAFLESEANVSCPRRIRKRMLSNLRYSVFRSIDERIKKRAESLVFPEDNRDVMAQ